MAVTIPQVQASQPETLTATATELGQKASGLAGRIEGQRANIDGLRSAWQGTASDAAVANAQPTLARMQQIHDALTRAETVLRDGGTQLAQTRSSLLGAVDQLKAQGWQVAPDGTVSVRPGSALDQYGKAGSVNAMMLQQLAAANTLRIKTQLASFDTADRQLNQNLRTAVGGLESAPQKFGPDGAPRPQAPYDTGSEIPVGQDPTAVKDWWTSLPEEKRAQLLKDWPEKLGNLNGIPVADRNVANQAIMQRDIDRLAEVAEARGVTTAEVLAHPELYGMAGPMMDRYNNAVKVKEALEANANKTGAPTFLQVYEPEAFGGDGRAAIAIGDPDHSDNTAVVVPGTGNSVGSGWLGSGDPNQSNDAVNLYNESRAADLSRSTAVVAWMGYDAPDGMSDPRVGATALAREGGQLLASDVNALNATHEGDGHMTVLGHSYGSTTVADAAAGYGMNTDDVVLVGCPGTDMADSAADFHLNESGRLYVGAASSDPVTLLGSAIPQTPVPGTGWSIALGDDPAMDGYGSTRFKAEVPGLTSPIGDHSQYYTRGGESLFSMAEIVSGHGDLLEQHEMTARHRIPEFSGLPVLNDPETYRPGTSGHTHQ